MLRTEVSFCDRPELAVQEAVPIKQTLNKCISVSYSKRSEREVRGAGQVLQLVWAHKELRRPLEKDGWKKTDFMVNLNPHTSTTNGPSTRANGTYEDSTTPLLDRGQCARKKCAVRSILTLHL